MRNDEEQELNVLHDCYFVSTIYLATTEEEREKNPFCCSKLNIVHVKRSKFQWYVECRVTSVLGKSTSLRPSPSTRFYFL